MAGRVQDAQPELPERQLLPVVQRPERIGDLRRLVQAELGAMLGGQPARAGDVVGVDVGVDHVAQPEVALLEQRLVLLDRERRIDDRRLVGLPRRDQVGGAAAPLVEELLEVHGQNLLAARMRGCIE